MISRMVPSSSAWGGTLLFAREPDPNFQDEFEEPVESVTIGQPEPNKPPRRRSWIFLILLATLFGGIYLASDPSLVLDLIGQGPPSTPSPVPQPVISQPPIESAAPQTSAPVSPPSTLPVTPDLGAVPSPLFTEGQRVLARSDATSPTGTVSLSADAEGSRSSSTIRAGATLTVQDAEFQNNTWVYSVRTEAGVKGWVPEGRLTAQ